ncbi:MAG: tetratricopeptide repeat protein [Bdellovibrionales bacterium]|nr:tetratricopeptide repeat protein [Bdellovibrionales bacterium]
MAVKMDKKELKGPDLFHSVSDRAFHWIEKNAGAVGALFGVLIVVGVVWVAYGYYQSHVESKAAEALYAPEAELRKAETSVREERAKAMQELAGLSTKAKSVAKPESVRPVDYAKDFAPLVEKLKSEVKRQGGTKAGLMSAMNLSSFLLQQKQYPEALTVLELVSYKPSYRDILGGFYLMHQGLVFMENQKYDDAAKAYQSVVDAKNLGAFHPEAMLKLGVAYELKGQADKAKQTYEKVGRDFPGSEASTSAQQYLRLLELKPQQG